MGIWPVVRVSRARVATEAWGSGSEERASSRMLREPSWARNSQWSLPGMTWEFDEVEARMKVSMKLFQVMSRVRRL